METKKLSAVSDKKTPASLEVAAASGSADSVAASRKPGTGENSGRLKAAAVTEGNEGNKTAGTGGSPPTGKNIPDLAYMRHYANTYRGKNYDPNYRNNRIHNNNQHDNYNKNRYHDKPHIQPDYYCRSQYRGKNSFANNRASRAPHHNKSHSRFKYNLFEQSSAYTTYPQDTLVQNEANQLAFEDPLRQCTQARTDRANRNAKFSPKKKQFKTQKDAKGLNQNLDKNVNSTAAAKRNLTSTTKAKANKPDIASANKKGLEESGTNTAATVNLIAESTIPIRTATDRTLQANGRRTSVTQPGGLYSPEELKTIYDKHKTAKTLKHISIRRDEIIIENQISNRTTAAANIQISNICDSAESVETQVKCPKISLIPLSKLLRNELLNLAEDNLCAINGAITVSPQTTPQSTPTKLIAKPNLVERRRKISTCSSSSSNTPDPLLEKVANMDKMGLMNVINNSGTKYDEALKLQARKRLREAIRKQLKSMNLEQPKHNNSVDYVTDDIVDSIHIPEVVLDEIRKAFGIEILDTANRNEQQKEQASTEHIACITENPISETPTVINIRETSNVERAAVSALVESGAVVQEVIQLSPAIDLASLLTSAEQKKADKSKSPTSISQSSKSYSPKSVDRAKSPLTTGNAPRTHQAPTESATTEILLDLISNLDRRKSATPERVPTNISSKSDLHRADAHAAKNARSSEKTRKHSTKERAHSHKNRSDVIVINSSSSSSSASSSSSSSSSSDSDSDSSARSTTSSTRRRRLKQKVDAENVVDSFEKLILASLSENLAERYNTKYSNSTYTKLHFISCICTSEYNSEKFTKIEVAKIQRNLKSGDRAIALEFLMREIVNVFNKQKKCAKRMEEAVVSQDKSSTQLMRPQTSKKSMPNSPTATQKADETDDNRIRKISETENTQSKSADAAEKVATATENVPKLTRHLNSNKRKRERTRTSSTMQSTPTEHQSANEQTLTQVGVAEKNAGHAKMTAELNEKAKLRANRNSKKINAPQNCITTKRAAYSVAGTDDNDDVDNEDDDVAARTDTVATEPSDEERSAEENSAPQPSQKRHCKAEVNTNGFMRTAGGFSLPFGGMDFTSTAISNFDLSCMNDINTLSALCQIPNYAPVDLNALKQQSPLGEAVVSNLREIDVKLLEMHKRKMFLEELLLKLQKSKMETDLLTVKLQNEKFMLLNTAMTVNASAAAASCATVKIEATKTAANAVKLQELITTTTNKKSVASAVANTHQKRTATKTTKNSRTEQKKATPSAKQKVTTATRKRLAAAVAEITPKRKCIVRKKKALASDNSDATTDKSQVVSTATAPAADNEKNVSSLPVDERAPSPQQPEETFQSWDYSTVLSGDLKGLKSAATHIRVYEDTVIASTEDGYLYKFNIRNRLLEEQFPKHSEAITQMHLCRDKKVLYTTSLDGYFKKTAIENFELDIQSMYLQEPLQSIDVQWNTAFIGSRWGNIFTYDTTANRLSDSLLCSTDAAILAIKATKEGPRKVLIISSKGNCVHFRDAITGLLLRSLDVPRHLQIFSLLLDYSCIYCGTHRKEIYKYDFTSGAALSILPCGNGAVSMQFYKNKYIFVGCYDGYIYVLDKGNSNQIGRFPGSGKMVLTLEIVGDKIISAAKDKTMKIIDIPNNIFAKMTY